MPLPVAANVLNRQFNPVAPNLAYVSDITYIRTGAGWLYLAIVLDLYARRVVGWAMAPSMPAKLVRDALNMAIQPRRPAPGLIMHSDRGSQYASELYQDLLDEHGFVCNMSRNGNCWDNAVAERVFLNLRMERVWQRQYANHTEARNDVADYIVSFYNCERLNAALGNLPPTVYERKWQRKNLLLCPKLLDHPILRRTTAGRTFSCRGRGIFLNWTCGWTSCSSIEGGARVGQAFGRSENGVER